MAPLNRWDHRLPTGRHRKHASGPDGFTLDIDAGQTITIVMPHFRNIAADPLAQRSDGCLPPPQAMNRDAITEGVSVTVSGVYTLTVGGVGSSQEGIPHSHPQRCRAGTHGSVLTNSIATAKPDPTFAALQPARSAPPHGGAWRRTSSALLCHARRVDIQHQHHWKQERGGWRRRRRHAQLSAR